MSTGTELTSTYQIEPLHGVANYNVWHIKMRHILIDLSLFKYVKSMAPPLAADKSNESAICKGNWGTRLQENPQRLG